VTSWPCVSSNVTRLVLIWPVPPMTQILMPATLPSTGAVANVRALSDQRALERHDVGSIDIIDS
jgi:hypothetical protein